MTREEQVEHWYIANAKKIKKWANKRSIQDAEDILQDTAIRLLTEKTDWEAITQKDITRWTMFDYYNKGSDIMLKMVATDDGMMLINDEYYTYPEETIYQKTLAEKALSELDKISGKSRDVFIMHFIDDLPYTEIAEKLNITHGTAKQLGSRVAKIIGEKIKEDIDK